MNKLIKIYTDGSSIGNPGPGGYGIVMLTEDGEYKKEFSQGFKITTNNRMELLAVIIGLENLKYKNCNVKIYTDSKYVKLGITEWIFNWKKNGWKTSSKKDVKNKNFWIELDHLVGQNEIVWEWVKGHSGNKYNDKVDELANQAISENL